MHEIKGVAAKDITKNVVDKEVHGDVEFSYDLLTEDLGMILGEDDCKCGKKGKYFIISGRMKESEIRGCGDTRVI